MLPHLDHETIYRRLQNLQNALTLLEQMRNIPFSELVDDTIKSWAVERGLERCIQDVLDIGAYILAAIGVPPPESYREIILLLGKQGIMPMPFAEQMAPMAGLRNLLVHEYLQIDFRQAYDLLQNRLDDFRIFAGYITEFLQANSS